MFYTSFPLDLNVLMNIYYVQLNFSSIFGCLKENLYYYLHILFYFHILIYICSFIINAHIQLLK